MLRRGSLLLLLGLALAPAAGAHVTATPAFLAIGAETSVDLEVPNERRGAPMTELSVIGPTDVEILAAESTGGWRGSTDGRSAAWTGGTLPPGETRRFRVRMLASGEPRPVELAAVQRFADGRGVRWAVALTVVPGREDEPEQYLGRALAVLLVGGAVVGGSLLVLHRTRR